MFEAIIYIKPLIDDVKYTIGTSNLASSVFLNFCIKNGFAELWNNCLEKAKEESMFDGLGDNDYNASNAFTLICNILYGNNKDIDNLYNFIVLALEWYIEDSNEKIDIKKLEQDFLILGKKNRQEMNRLSMEVTEDNFPDTIIEDGSRYNEIIKKIDHYIYIKDYTACITCCYTLCEGILKGYCKNYKVEDVAQNDEINKLMVIVKKDLRDRFSELTLIQNNVYNVFSAITNIVRSIRNNNSDSHYAEKSDYITASTIRYMVIMVSNFFLKLFEMKK